MYRDFQVAERVERALASPSALGRAQEMHDHHSRGRHNERVESVQDLRGPKGASSGILESFVGAHSLNILSRLRSLSGGPSGGGCNWWQLRPHGNMGMALPSHHPGHLTWDQGCIWYFGRWEVHRNSPNHSQTRSFIPKSQNTSLLVIDLEYCTVHVYCRFQNRCPKSTY